MLKKLLRLVFTLVGGIIGYGAFLLTKYLLTISDIGPGRGFTQWQHSREATADTGTTAAGLGPHKI